MNVEPAAANPVVTGAIRQAARMTGADFQYLLATAQVESNLNPNAQAPASTAKGLFLFIDQTWLATLKEQGPAVGYGPYAAAIERQPTGEYAVDPRMRNAVLNLRTDPTANALMAGAYTRANAEKLAARLDRSPTEGEPYIAHFLGASGAARLISIADSRPDVPAAAVFPGAAQANRSVFFDARGSARGIGEVYRELVARYGVARGPAPNNAMVAGEQGHSGQPRSAFAPDPVAMTATYAAAAQLHPAAQPTDSDPVFYGLFRSPGSAEPGAPVVNALWGAQPAANSLPANPIPPVPGGANGKDTDLGPFQDQTPDARALFRARV